MGREETVTFGGIGSILVPGIQEVAFQTERQVNEIRKLCS